MNKIFNPIQYEERFFWTLEELLKTHSEDWKTLGEESIRTYTKEKMSDYAGDVLTLNPPSIPEWKEPEYAKVINLVVKRFLEHYCFYTLTEERDESKGNRFIYKLLNVLYMTAPRYLTLLRAYETSKNDLLSPVKVESNGVSRFNDTPQDEGTFDDDPHTTNITEDSRTSKNDLDTKMGRIKEIESSYNNLLLIWSNEFEGLFLEENNI